jgi:hypothetical protein
MKWETVAKTALLMIVAGIVFYLVCPKYYFFTAPVDDTSLSNFFRCNRITGKVEIAKNSFNYCCGGWKVFQKY